MTYDLRKISGKGVRRLTLLPRNSAYGFVTRGSCGELKVMQRPHLREHVDEVEFDRLLTTLPPGATEVCPV